MEIRIAIGQLRPKKGDYAANVARLGDVFAQLARLQPRPDVLVLAETALTGYFLEGGVRDAARTAGEVVADLQATYLQALGADAPPLDVIAGFYERYRDRFYNSAIYATLGVGSRELGVGDSALAPNLRLPTPGIRHVHRKVFLPTYGVFDEARFVEAGHHVAAFDTRFGRAAILICEDAWHSLSGTVAALDGAQVVFVVSASPARGIATTRPGNVEHWEDLVRRIADEHGVFGVLAQLVGFEGGKGFPGGSFVIGPRGDIPAAHAGRMPLTVGHAGVKKQGAKPGKFRRSGKRRPSPGPIAQLARAPARHAGGHRFKSCIAQSLDLTEVRYCSIGALTHQTQRRLLVRGKLEELHQIGDLKDLHQFLPQSADHQRSFDCGRLFLQIHKHANGRRSHELYLRALHHHLLAIHLVHQAVQLLPQRLQLA